MIESIQHGVLINPPADRLGGANVILRGSAAQYHVESFSGPLSIKSVIRGSATWRVGRSRLDVDRDSYLVLNDGQPYSLAIDAANPVETFCVFFRRGFVEDAFRSGTAQQPRLLDEPFTPPAMSIGFFESLHPCTDGVATVLRRLRELAAYPEVHWERLDSLMYAFAGQLVHLRSDLDEKRRRLSAVRPATREELVRRLHLGRRAIEQSISEPLKLDQIARAACLSIFHFHRQFTAYFGETPHRFALRLRMAKAALLLEESDDPASIVGFQCGFESPGSFGTAFRERYGMTPGQFRRAKKARSK